MNYFKKKFLKTKNKFLVKTFLTYSYKPQMYLIKLKLFNFNEKNLKELKANLKKNENQMSFGLNSNLNSKKTKNDFFNFKNEEDDSMLNIDTLTENLNLDSISDNKDNFKDKNLEVKSFDLIVKNYFSKVVRAFLDLMLTNKEIDLNLNDFDEIEITVEKIGKYFLKKELNNKISLHSPISGFYKYEYDFKNEQFVNEKDKHILDELLIREFCKHSSGLLLIN